MHLQKNGETVPRVVQPPLVEEEIDLEQVRAAPLAFLDDYTRRYGTVFRYRAGPWNAVVVNQPDCVHKILQADGERYTKLGTPDLMMLRPMLGEGLMTSEGPLWQEQRDEAAPCFSRRSAADYVPEMIRAIEGTAQRWRGFAGNGEARDIEGEMNRLTLQIVVKCLFGFDLAEHTGEFSEAVETMNKSMAHFDGSDTELRNAFDTALRKLHAIVYQILLKRQIMGSMGSQDDLLARLSKGSEGRRLFDRIFTFVMAGHETTAKALCWTFHLVSQHPEVEQRLAEEAAALPADGYADLEMPGRLPYTRAVLQEAMRLYPPVWSMTRIALGDEEVGGFHIERGSLILISPYVMHRHQDYWKNPLAFNPDRFLQPDSHPPHCYLPFSHGPRMCIGRFFAQTEGLIAISMLMKEFRLTPKPGHTVVPEALITLRPRNGLPMLISRR
jgi:cytochrome P450